jgi:hypothetical protein
LTHSTNPVNGSFKILIAFVASLIIGIIIDVSNLRNNIDPKSELLESNFGIMIGFIFSLTAIFFLQIVWTRFKGLKEAIASETESIISLHVNTDFLDDEKVSDDMKTALLNYLDIVTHFEFRELKKGVIVDYPTTQFLRIKKIIDQIKFDDPRDPLAFGYLVDGFKELSKSRNHRLEISLTRLPRYMSSYFLTICAIFWLVFLLNPMEGSFVYYLVYLTTTTIVLLTVFIMKDLDDPLNGVLQVSKENYVICKNYIESDTHEIFSD